MLALREFGDSAAFVVFSQLIYLPSFIFHSSSSIFFRGDSFASSDHDDYGEFVADEARSETTFRHTVKSHHKFSRLIHAANRDPDGWCVRWKSRTTVPSLFPWHFHYRNRLWPCLPIKRSSGQRRCVTFVIRIPKLKVWTRLCILPKSRRKQWKMIYLIKY